MSNDPFGDVVTRNGLAQMRRRTRVIAPASDVRARVLDLLTDERVIVSYFKVDTNGSAPTFEMKLRYGEAGRTAARGTMRVKQRNSEPGRVSRASPLHNLAIMAKAKYSDFVASISDPEQLRQEIERLEFQEKLRKWRPHFTKAESKENLSENYYDWYITLDYENGNYAIGQSSSESLAAFEVKHGPRGPTLTTHIGSASR